MDEFGDLAELQPCDILDPPRDGVFDAHVRFAARLFDVPIAIIDLVDDGRIWFESARGRHVADVPREPGWCTSALSEDISAVIADMHIDPVALTNPVVALGIGLRFHVTYPLRSARGHDDLGTLCIVDRQPRELNEHEVGLLHDLATLVVHELEVRLAARHAIARETSLREDAERHDRLSDSLARTLQTSLLPPALPRIEHLELAAGYEPADPAGVGGDFYDVFPLPDKEWGLVIGDVSGKGPAAASLTASARYALRAAAIEHEEPSRVLRVVNDTLLLGKLSPDDNRFCTLVFARLVPTEVGFKVTFACGGHPRPRVLRQSGRVDVVGEFGTLVGALEAPRFIDSTLELVAGDTLFMFTDGLTEARIDDHLLGLDGVDVLLSGDASLGLADLVKHLTCIPSSSGAASDDVAVLAVRAVPR